jgi:hypothetical protein
LNYPSVSCPSADDPALARLTFAFFGVPLVWLVGIGLALLGADLAASPERTAPIRKRLLIRFVQQTTRSGGQENYRVGRGEASARKQRAPGVIGYTRSVPGGQVCPGPTSAMTM